MFLENLNETYHSTHGAIQESKHVFIKNGLHALNCKNEIKILEVGMGTGLNLLLTALEASKNNLNISYTALEPNPIPKEIVTQLNYTTLLNDPDTKIIFDIIHQNLFDVNYSLNMHVNLLKHQNTIQSFSGIQKFDLIYFDAFAPQKQPEMWTSDIFIKLRELMSENSILVTYCAKGEVKRTLKSAGFEIESLPGPPGKREMTRATKK